MPFKMLTKFIFAWFLSWLPLVITSAIILLLVVNNFWANIKFLNKLSTKKLIYIFLGFSILFNLILSTSQYITWQSSDFSRFFLPPHTPLSYFIRYSFFHFWLANIISVMCSFGFFFIFKLIKKYRTEIISDQELLLILLSSLLVGWPKFVIFVPLFLAVALIFTLINLLIFRRAKNNLNLPIIISLLVTFLAGNYLINFLSLSPLII